MSGATGPPTYGENLSRCATFVLEQYEPEAGVLGARPTTICCRCPKRFCNSHLNGTLAPCFSNVLQQVVLHVIDRTTLIPDSKRSISKRLDCH
mmetsp:Transcript_2583/g.4578  ORF Transcript_2583/g.4578 Transcript_2583/m.4578 type:complete len:93 (-) Transcript_2583:343-621(-)